MSIIQLGLVRDVLIEEKNARLKMILTTPFCPYGPGNGGHDPGRKLRKGSNMPVVVEMGMDVWDFSMMEDPTSLDWGLYT